nr:hypothetical protein [Tanacetum cinerariifolium]
MSNTKNDTAPTASKSSCNKNKGDDVEEHHRNLLLSKNKKHMSSACNNVKFDSQNVISKVVCAMCKKCLISVNHDVCLLNYVNGKTSYVKKQKANVSTKENQKKQKPKVKKTKKVGFIERLATPKPSKTKSFLRWSPTRRLFDLKGKIITSSKSESQSDCSNGDNACTSNHLEPTIKWFLNSTSFLGRLSKFVYGTVRFGNDHVAVILGFSDLQWENILITRVYYVKGLGHNLFSVGQFRDSDLEVAFRRNACFVRNLEGVDLLSGNRTTNLYTIILHDMAPTSPICLMARTSSMKSWLWHQRLSHLNFDSINNLAKHDLVLGLPKFKYHKEHLCPSCRGYIFSIWICVAEAIATACFTQNRSIIHCRFNKTPYELINERKPDISFLHVFGALCYPKNDSEDIRKLGAKELDLTYASSTITTQQPTEGELNLLFKSMYDDHISGQPSVTQRTVPTAQVQQVSKTSTTSTSIADTTPRPTNSSSQATNSPSTSQDVNGLRIQQQQPQQQGNQALLQSETIADNVSNAMFDTNSFVNPFATTSTSAAESSSQNVDPSNMHTFYQPYPHVFQWTKDHPLKQVIGEPLRPVLTRNQLRSDGDMCIYALMVNIMEPKNVKEAMTDPAWIESMQEELL